MLALACPPARLSSVPAPAAGGGPVDPEDWTLVVPEREGVAIEDMDVFEAGAVLYERHAGRPEVAVLPLAAGLPLEQAAAGMHRVRSQGRAAQERSCHSAAPALLEGDICSCFAEHSMRRLLHAALRC